MALELNHTIVPAHDKEASARWLADILGAAYEGAMAHFSIVRINEHLTLDYDHADEFEHHHYAFKVDEASFDKIFARVEEEEHRLWQPARRDRRHEDQSPARRPRLLFPRPQRPYDGSADGVVCVTSSLRDATRSNPGQRVGLWIASLRSQ